MSRKFVFGGSYSGAVPLLLDTYPAEVAWSLRKLRNAVINVIRVRRSGDNAELDFTETTINDGSLVSWVVAGGGTQNGFVTKFYNQGIGGSTFDAIQTLAIGQPFIVESGVLSVFNSKPCARFGISSQGMPVSLSSATFKTLFSVTKVDVENTVNYILGKESPFNGVWVSGTATTGFGGFDGTSIRQLTGKDTNQKLSYMNMKSSKVYLSQNGASPIDAGSFASSLTIDRMGGRDAASFLYFQGKMNEIILFNNDQSANKSAIENNINTYYAIY